MVLKFLGIGKKSDFFMEAPPADPKSAAKAKSAAPEPSHVEAKVAAPAAETNGKTASKPSQASQPVKEAKAEPAQAKAAAPAPAATPVPKAEPVLTNFATTLQLNNTPRRRPGPSLNGFKEMAKKVNPSNR